MCVRACVVHPVNHSNELLTEFTHAGVRHKMFKIATMSML